jgi:hypothetical protein
MAAAVQWQWNAATAPPEKKARWPGAGDLGKRLIFGLTLWTRDYFQS